MYGGKADSLYKLKINGFNVPNFFVVTIDDYSEFLEDNNLLDSITRLIKEDKRYEIKDLIKNCKLNTSLENRIMNKFKKLNSKLVSVRSSALNEDGINKAFAGQYDSFLNVSESDLIDKIKLCWISYYNSNVNEYSKNDEILGMNVIIQEMIDADYAGVAFSIDPISDTDNYSIVEVVKGLGENLVSGKVTPTKFIIRRATNHVDLKIGNITLADEIVERLEGNVLKIERVYQHPMDIEYAITNNVIYILQARPITTKNVSLKPYSLSITRPKSIIEMEMYYKGEYEGIKKITRDLYYFKPLFVYNPNHENVGVYYNDYDLEEDPSLMFYYMDLDFKEIKDYYDTVIKSDIKYIQNVLSSKDIDNLKKLTESIIRVYPFISLGQIAGHFEDITDRVKEFLIDFRNKYDTIIHNVSDYMIDYIKDDLPFKYKAYAYFITLDEYLNGLPSIDELKVRKEGYIYFGELYVTNDYDKWFQEKNISVMHNEESSLKGDVAYPKSVKGKVCIIYSEKDFDKFEKGDILVTPMTVPKFMKVIKMANGIITDEGGITCHASIIARELKIPCVVGCKNATKVLKDGDFVRIDGATGNIIKL